MGRNSRKEKQEDAKELAAAIIEEVSDEYHYIFMHGLLDGIPRDFFLALKFNRGDNSEG